MSDFDKWFFNTGGDCYGSNSEEYKISKVTWDYQQKKIDAVLKYIDCEEWSDEYGDNQCPTLKIKELLND